jgi:hypothetical protein
MGVAYEMVFISIYLFLYSFVYFSIQQTLASLLDVSRVGILVHAMFHQGERKTEVFQVVCFACVGVVGVVVVVVQQHNSDEDIARR